MQSRSEALLEREAETAAIAESVRAAAGGEGRIVLVDGPAGIGKTALLETLRDNASEAGLRVLHARGGELERDLAFGVVRLLYAPLAASARRAPPAGHARLAAAVLADPDADLAARDPVESPFAALHALYRLTAGLAADRPLALVVDDAHHADEASVRFLSYAARRLGELPVLLAVGCRPSGAAELLTRELAAVEGAMPLRPRPLSPQGTARLLRSIVPEADDELCRACHEATGGNVYYVREMAHGLATREPPLPHIRGWSPEAVTRAVAGRLLGVSEPARQLAEAAAVLGQTAALRHAAALAGLSTDVASGAADELRGAFILTGRRPLEFVHPIVRAAVHRNLPSGRAAHAHAEAARLLTEEHADVERIAAHLLATEPAANPAVCAQLATAAQTAVARGAPEVAVRYLRRAVDEGPPAEMDGPLHVALGMAEALTFDAERAIARLRHAVEAAATPDGQLEPAMLLASVQAQSGSPVEALTLLSGLLERLGHEHPAAALVEAHIVNVGRYVTSTRRLVEPHAKRLLERVDAGEDLPAPALASAAADLAMHGARAERCAELAAQTLERHGIPNTLVDTEPFTIGARVLAVCDRFDEAADAYEQALDAARTRGAPYQFAMLSIFRADLNQRRGDINAAEADARNAYELAVDSGWPVGLPACVAGLVNALLERGELDEADSVVASTDLDAPADALTDVYTFALLLFSRGRLRLAQGRIEAGLGDLLACGDRLEEHGELNPALMPWRSSAAPALAASGDAEQATALVAEEVRRARAFGAPRALGIALRGAGALGDVDATREAVAVLSPSGALLEYAQALADLGEQELRAGDTEAARRLMRESLALAHTCGGAALERRVLEGLHAAGARPRRALLTGPGALTPSERRTAEMAASGMSNREIAEALFVTVGTVEFHLGKAFRKLGVSSRAQLAAALAE
jgi:ATP/maltotriose-dependent transcriptional regulator MalT